MTISERQADPKTAGRTVQGPGHQDWRGRCRAAMVAPVLGLLLAGCSTLDALNPVSIYHRIEGGTIAEQRPPLPGAGQTEPNLSTVPARPAPPDRAAMERLTQGLVADRENARYSNAANPLPDPSQPSTSPALFGAGTLPPPVKPPPATAASASLPAASAPPAPASPAVAEQPAAPPSAAPRKAVESTPLPAPAASQDAAVPADVPAISPAPPTRPAEAPVAAPSPAAVVTPLPAAPPPVGAGGLSVSFDPGVSTLSPVDADALKAFAARRRGAAVAVTGYGDAVSSDPAAQAKALGLAIARAKTVSDALVAAGVPAGAIQSGGEAAGRGAFVRLLK